MKNVLLGGALTLLTTIASVSAWAAPVVEMKTNLGTIIVELNEAAAPKHVANFLEYAKSGFYEGTIFHRVIPGFMAQGGGFDKDMKQKATRSPVQHEGEANLKVGVKNERGTIAQARTNDPNSGTSQFFINYKSNDFLDHKAPQGAAWGYTVFGKVISGMDVVDKMAEQPSTNSGGHANVPVTPIIVEKVTVKK